MQAGSRWGGPVPATHEERVRLIMDAIAETLREEREARDETLRQDREREAAVALQETQRRDAAKRMEDERTWERIDRQRAVRETLDAQHERSLEVAAAALGLPKAPEGPRQEFRETVQVTDPPAKVHSRRLEQVGLSADTLQLPQFTDAVWLETAARELDKPQRSAPGILRSSFGTEGVAGLRRIVVTDRAVDAISYLQLKPQEAAKTCCISTLGSLTPDKKREVADALADLSAAVQRAGGRGPVTVVAAVGVSVEAQRLVKQLGECLPRNIDYSREFPQSGQMSWTAAVESSRGTRGRDRGGRSLEMQR